MDKQVIETMWVNMGGVYHRLKVCGTYGELAMVGLGRFELPTSPLSGVRSNQLSYRPKISINVSNYTTLVNYAEAILFGAIILSFLRTLFNSLHIPFFNRFHSTFKNTGDNSFRFGIGLAIR